MTAAGTPPRRTPVPLEEARRALRDGAAVVLPNPAPLTHVVTACRARAVNEAKGRPAGQPVALWAQHPDTLRALGHVWDLGPGQGAMARWLLAHGHLTVLVRVRDTEAAPAWTGPALKDGWMLLFGARWQPLRPLLDEHPVLYVSSADRTGQPPAATTDEALDMFPAGVPVLPTPEPDGPHTAAAGTARRATTTVRSIPGAAWSCTVLAPRTRAAPARTTTCRNCVRVTRQPWRGAAQMRRPPGLAPADRERGSVADAAEPVAKARSPAPTCGSRAVVRPSPDTGVVRPRRERLSCGSPDR
ncbi:hypothetical protein ABZ299_18100 [Streptomyces sp. NPDC006184]|uniref:hypothetical protein n=1 Tax=Streptomyces sp. NPDC006184 TaxID=3155455 RepID=UPI0033ABEB43